MKHHYILHRSFLIFMFVVCAVAVVFFMKQRVNAYETISNITNSGTISAYPINGNCGAINGKTVTNKPIGILCIAGSQSSVVETDTGWGWRCQGVNNGTTAYCSVLRYVQPVATETIPTTYTTPNTTPNTTTNTTTVATNNTATDTATIPKTEDTVKATAITVTEPVSTTTERVTNSEITTVPNTTDNKTVKTTTTPISTNYNVTSMIAPIVENGTVVIEKEQPKVNAQEDVQINDKQDVAIVQQSEIITAPVVIQAKKLAQKNNPKTSGTVDVSLKIENVTLNKNEDGNNRVALTGKSEPSAVITIYIFSNDPTVITVKSDVNGNWSYALDKELADGQHEVYVAVTDDAGKIISKSEPIAFVKTAQAASMIPMSQLSANQSPIERSSQQYVLIAIIIMSVFLVAALISIGFLSYNRNLDEEIDQ